jgi:hypothetical protein
MKTTYHAWKGFHWTQPTLVSQFSLEVAGEGYPEIYSYEDDVSCGSSGSIVSDYGLDDRQIEVRSPTGAEDFSSSPCVQTSSEAHPASYPMGTGGPFPGGKAQPGRDADHSPPPSGQG